MKCTVSYPVLAALVSSVVVGCSGTENAGTGPPSGLATYGACGLQPNYVAMTFFDGRFIRFPLNVFIDLSGAPADLASAYTAALEQGFSAWQTASGGQIGRVSFVDSPGFAHVTARFVPLIPGAGFALAASQIVDIQSGSPNLISQTIIEFSTTNLSPRFDQKVRGGTLSLADFTTGIAGIAAHEFGHSLGIKTHPADGTEWLMSTNGFDVHSVPTEADLNTLRENYCRP